MNHSFELILRLDSVRFDSVYSGLSGFHSDSILIQSYSIGFGSICLLTRSGLTPVRLVRRVLFGVTLPSKSASTSEVDALLAVKLLREARQPLRLTRFSKQLYSKKRINLRG